MNNKKYYPQKRNKNYPNKQNITNPNIINNKPRYQQGHQNQLMTAFRKTETYYKDKTVIVTESFNVVEFNNDEFEFELGVKKHNNQYKYRRKR